MKPFIQCFVFAATLSSGAMAQTTTDVIEEVVVIAHPLSGEGLSQAADVLQGAELDQKKANNIGETLAKQPGIHSAQLRIGTITTLLLLSQKYGARLFSIQKSGEAVIPDLSYAQVSHCPALE